MRSRPALFCDIDGVLSLWGWPSGTPQSAWPDGRWADIEGIPHYLSHTAAIHLSDLQSKFDVIWASGWEERANTHLPHALGLGPFPYLELDAARTAGHGPGEAVPSRRSVRGHWKLPSIAAWAGPDRPLAFVDDVLDERCWAWAAERSLRVPTLLVETRPPSGLDDAAAAKLHAFADGLARDDAA
ncbi:hypothetical protein [Conexibacter sp. SYSU D00693]|uniref:hypothetical protein n=1 Tax=Conexibacter sp. SYSU D00693 TaxID=2812560 RepID=UPI00196B3253|nr:hypothetical protein [Conexibacter sp. SYSU D00693]